MSKGGRAGTAAARPSGRRLSLQRIVDETLALIDERGIAAATMRTVGDRLGVGPMSLYRYVANREALFDEVVERVVNELDGDPGISRPAPVEWRDYLTELAWGVRRYAMAHPHAFPLVATRPTAAPWVNPPLRSLRWIEALLHNLGASGFDDEQTVFAYRTFNSFLLGNLLLETSAAVLADPQPGDGSFQPGTGDGPHDPVDPADPVPGSITPTRRTEHREQIADADSAAELLDPAGEVGETEFPLIHRLQKGLTEDHFEDEFAAGLDVVLDRIAAEVRGK